MTHINVSVCGIVPGGDISAKLAELIEKVPEHSELFFPAGEYFLEQCVGIKGKKHLTLCGEPDGSTRLLTHFSPSGDPKENNNAFQFTDCEDILISDFTCSTDNPISCAGRVTAIHAEENTYDVKIADEFPVTGKEHLAGANSCDAEGTPDYALATYFHPLRSREVDGVTEYYGEDYTIIGEHEIRVKAAPGCSLSRLTVGHRILYRYIIYGNTVFGFHSCRRVKLARIEIERCASFGATVSPRSADFTFEAFNMRMPKDSAALYCANADGIHILGLEGYLRMKNCHFNGLGDDALNIHSKAGDIAAIDGDTFRIVCRNRKMEETPLGNDWARPGDTICIYDRETFLRVGTMEILSWDGSFAKVKLTDGTASVGNILANDAYFASVHLDSCSVQNTRARGFLLQSRNMLVENCLIRGMSLPGIIISPDVRVWYEVGPSDHVEIRNCTFEKCAYIANGSNRGAIVVKAAHDAGAPDYPAGVHSDIAVRGCTFRDMNSSGICITATDGVVIENNRFENCRNTKNASIAGSEYDIVTHNCTNVTVSGNVTDKAPEMLALDK